MKRLVLAACVSLAVLLLPVAASAQPAHADSPKVTITLAQDVVLGTTTLRPGAYKFQCRTFDGKTFLVVTSESGKEITRVACEQEILDAKVAESELRTLLRADGTRTLTGVRLKGEKVSHRIVD
jgi:hypothetical protein